MNKTDKEYVCGVIRQKVEGGLLKCSCKPPSLQDHIYKALVEDRARPISGRALREVAKEKVLRSISQYRDTSLNLTDLFVEPDSYKEELKTFQEEERRHEKSNREVRAKMETLIHSVNLGEFDNGKDAIAQSLRLIPRSN